MRDDIRLKSESLVAPVPSLLGVITPDGHNIPVERLGPGIVRGINSDGEVLVHWAGANADTLMAPADIQSLDPSAHLVTVTRLNARGARLATRHKIVNASGFGIEHNWEVELLPKGVVRAVRSDGCVWTFGWNSILRRMSLMHNTDYPPPQNDDAEALTVAELAVS